MNGIFVIELEKVRLFAHHGVFDFERQNGNNFEINLKVSYQPEDSENLLQDDLNNTICYGSLYEIIKEEMSISSKLLETVAYRIVNRIFTEYPNIKGAECKITKLTPPIEDFDGKASVTFSYVND